LLIRSRDELATSLEQRIVSGEFGPGALLPSERLLADEYGLSRSMVREALRMLAERRLIDVVPGRGSFVRRVSAADSADRLTDVFDRRQVTARTLIEARLMVETTAAGFAAARADETDLLALAGALDAFDQAPTLTERLRGDLAFHLAIARAAGNPLIETMFRAIQPYTVELMIRSLIDETVTIPSVPFHRRILDGIRDRQPGAAEAAMRAHLAVGLSTYGDDLDENLAVVTRRSMAELSENDLTLDAALHWFSGDRPERRLVR
jgi:GntR family transcriptional repressor for pyruvate dehydrogenase complex